MRVKLSKELSFISCKTEKERNGLKSGVVEETAREGLYILWIGKNKQIIKQKELDQILALGGIEKEKPSKPKDTPNEETKDDPALENLSLDELKAMANELYVDLDKRLGKAKLIDLIKEAKKEK